MTVCKLYYNNIFKMSEKESNVRSTNFLKEETRDAWDKWVMLAQPHAQSKGFWRAFNVLSANLAAMGATSYMEGDHVTMVAADGLKQKQRKCRNEPTKQMQWCKTT